MKDFVVIQFIPGKEVDYVPSTWLSEDKDYVFYPKRKCSEFLKNKNIANSEPKSNWEKYKIVIIKSYDTASKADKKADQFLDHSDLESSANERGSVNSQQPVTPLAINLPPGSFIFESGDTSTSVSVSHTREVHVDAPAVVHSEVSEEVTIPSSSISFGNSQQANNQNTFTLTAVDLGTGLTCSGSALLQVILDENRAFQKKALENQELIIQEQREVKGLLLQVVTGNIDRDAATSKNCSVFQYVPMKSSSDLDAIDVYLNNEDNYNLFKESLRRFGRPAISSTIHAILRYCFTHEFSKQVRYTSKSPGKIPLEGRKFVEVVRDSVIAQFPSATDDVINSKIGAWLRGSADRHGGTQKRKNDGNSKKNIKTPRGESCSSCVKANTPSTSGSQNTSSGNNV